jgi:tetratricopeptide (TPR) repeat protein
MDQLTIQQAFVVATQHHAAGRLNDAEQLYRSILARQPRHAGAMHNLGLIAHQMKRDDVALELIRGAIAIDPNYADAYKSLGHILRRQGQTEEAVVAYRRAIALNPTDAEAHANLGFALKNKGQLDEAIAAYRQATALRPDYAHAYYNLGIALKDAGRLDEAIAAYRRAIACEAGFYEAHSNLGVALRDAGRLDEAVAAYRQAVALRPGLAPAHFNLGIALHEAGFRDQSITAYRHAVALDPGMAQAHDNLGNVLRDCGRLDEAIVAHRQAIALQPHFAQSQYNLGNALRDAGDLDGAVAAFRQAVALRPDFAEAHYNLGNVLREAARLDEAVAALRQAVALRPNYAEAHNNLGITLHYQLQREKGIAASRTAIRLQPDYAEAHYNLARGLLSGGDFEEGWSEHEWRLKAPGLQPARTFPQPRWHGEDLHGKIILVYTEQGFGDAIQFLRYVPLLARRGAKVVLEIQPELKRIAQRLEGVSRLLERGDALADFDFHCPILSLPLAFKTTLESIPANVPYLFPDAQFVESWGQKFPAVATGFKVALAWAGSPQHKGDRSRSIPLHDLAPLSRADGVTFFSVQKGRGESEANEPPAGLRLVNLAPDLHDFADTAAVLCLMDLVITADTSVAHLAGALGRPVWVILPTVPDWRWLHNRQDSPWYPTMRLFRQTKSGDWGGVISRVGEALAAFVEEGGMTR